MDERTAAQAFYDVFSIPAMIVWAAFCAFCPFFDKSWERIYWLFFGCLMCGIWAAEVWG